MSILDSESLKQWALVAEIIGGAAIVITLVILVFELQQNTTAVQRATYSEITQSLDEWRYQLTLNPDVRAVFEKFDQQETLTSEEASIRVGLGRTLYSIYERAYWANEYGQVGEPEWARFERMICASLPRFWDGSSEFIYTEEFIEYINGCSAE